MKRKYRVKVFLLFYITLTIIGCGAHWRSAQNAHKGHNRLKDGNPDEAIKYFELALKDRGLAGSYGGLYRAYAMKADPLSAEKYLAIGLNLYPEDRWLNKSAGEFNLYYKKDYETAIYFLQKAKKKFRQRSIRNSIDELIHEATTKLNAE